MIATGEERRGEGKTGDTLSVVVKKDLWEIIIAPGLGERRKAYLPGLGG